MCFTRPPLLAKKTHKALHLLFTHTHTHTVLNQQSALLYLTTQASAEGELCWENDWPRWHYRVAPETSLKEIRMLLYFYHQFFSLSVSHFLTRKVHFWLLYLRGCSVYSLSNNSSHTSRIHTFGQFSVIDFNEQPRLHCVEIHFSGN